MCGRERYIPAYSVGVKTQMVLGKSDGAIKYAVYMFACIYGGL